MFRRRREPPMPAADPVVIVSITRTGSTLVQRILSAHPDLVIWGEHFGVLSQLRGALEILDRSREQLAAGHAQRHHLLDRSLVGVDLSPQVNPFDLAGFEDAARRFVLDLFRSELPATSRWGFKEVHYFTSDLRFLLRLFPGTRVIVLVRRPETQISSFVRAPWRATPNDSDEWRAELASTVRAAAADWDARYGELRRFAAAHPDCSMVVRYEDIGTARLDLDALFAHCGLSTPDRSDIETITGERSFSSDSTPGWDTTARSYLDDLIATLEFPPEHAELLAHYYPDDSPPSPHDDTADLAGARPSAPHHPETTR